MCIRDRSYVLFWRNAWDKPQEEAYLPGVGDGAIVEDFKAFKKEKKGPPLGVEPGQPPVTEPPKPGRGSQAGETSQSGAAEGGDVTIKITWWGGQSRHDYTH